ncbi:uridine diphosphate glucose pyrophosphatase isoform X2 [Sus scrofa]|uniref:uridine diphosphate glucose pyrophosphatase isoform X2 n=1 Tax=Sus scrofa TaxID=9823 RepID=UPI000A2AFDF9|nr:uridine diphosphate glucose pyrophosphatase isoform X2 [Sus scrofa]
MERIEGAAVGRCADSPYLRPLTLHYRQNGTQKSWDFVKTHDSVTLLMFNASRRSLVLVKQFRPAVYAGAVERLFPGSLVAADQDRPRELPAALPGSAGVTFELCAGLVDQPGLSLEEVACKEAWEECGYRLAPSDLRRVASYKAPGPCSVAPRPPQPRAVWGLLGWQLLLTDASTSCGIKHRALAVGILSSPDPACSRWELNHVGKSQPACSQVWRWTDWLQPDHVLRSGDRCPEGRPRRGPGRGGRAH